ncbi:Potassium voltage-gated channel protein Shaker [Paragonimus heterotremus]|uniref:Potassium voltage-gated channel protein Shaker n=1 Tax=Paragonimus heterotremus TaxID=100268 RepID=A0A8J4WIQ3_9TREM|nr:Potassium voltage-gated channel protein Shaker [Paragonimus heterotremus]
MIYTPSLMRPLKGCASELISCNLSTGNVNESYKQRVHNAISFQDMSVVAICPKKHSSDVRHSLHRPPSVPRCSHRHASHISVAAKLTKKAKLVGFVCKQLSLPTDCASNCTSSNCRSSTVAQINPHLDPTFDESAWTLNCPQPTEADCSERLLMPDRFHDKYRSCPTLKLNTEATDISPTIIPDSTSSVSCFTTETRSDLQPPFQHFPICHLGGEKLSNRLMYFPRINNQLRVQFKDKSSSNSGSVHLPILEKAPMEAFLPYICGRSVQNFGHRVPVFVEKKGSRTSAKSIRRKMSEYGTRAKQLNLRTHQARLNRFKNRCVTQSSKESEYRNESNPANISGRDYSEIDRVELNIRDHVELGESEPVLIGSTCCDCRRVVLNVSGLRFETWIAVLDNHPTTLLGSSTKRRPFWDPYTKEYFFDRHRPSFEAIFNYYQYGGRLKRPGVVADDVFLSELEFFEIEADAVESYKKSEGYVPEVIMLPEKPWKRRLWLLFEYPETSLLAFCFSVASVIFTIVSIILFCVETLPIYADTHCKSEEAPNFLDPFFIIETACTIWFTFELIIRFISCPSHRSFIKDIKNLIDLAAIVPYYITLTNVLISYSCEGAKSSASLAFLRVIRLIRVFKLTKHSSGLQVLVLTFKESVEGLSLFLVAFIVCILVFSSTIYYVEIDRKGSQIESIPDAFWWAVITMCTVGYGDKVPKGPLGKIVGSVCAVAGVLTLAIPVPIITENFNKFYAHKTGRGRR